MILNGMLNIHSVSVIVGESIATMKTGRFSDEWRNIFDEVAEEVFGEGTDQCGWLDEYIWILKQKELTERQGDILDLLSPSEPIPNKVKQMIDEMIMDTKLDKSYIRFKPSKNSINLLDPDKSAEETLEELIESLKHQEISEN